LTTSWFRICADRNTSGWCSVEKESSLTLKDKGSTPSVVVLNLRGNTFIKICLAPLKFMLFCVIEFFSSYQYPMYNLVYVLNLLQSYKFWQSGVLHPWRTGGDRIHPIIILSFHLAIFG